MVERQRSAGSRSFVVDVGKRFNPAEKNVRISVNRVHYVAADFERRAVFFAPDGRQTVDIDRARRGERRVAKARPFGRFEGAVDRQRAVRSGSAVHFDFAGRGQFRGFIVGVNAEIRRVIVAAFVENRNEPGVRERAVAVDRVPGRLFVLRTDRQRPQLPDDDAARFVFRRRSDVKKLRPGFQNDRARPRFAADFEQTARADRQVRAARDRQRRAGFRVRRPDDRQNPFFRRRRHIPDDDRALFAERQIDRADDRVRLVRRFVQNADDALRAPFNRDLFRRRNARGAVRAGQPGRRIFGGERRSVRRVDVDVQRRARLRFVGAKLGKLRNISGSGKKNRARNERSEEKAVQKSPTLCVCVVHCSFLLRPTRQAARRVRLKFPTKSLNSAIFREDIDKRRRFFGRVAALLPLLSSRPSKFLRKF